MRFVGAVLLGCSLLIPAAARCENSDAAELSVACPGAAQWRESHADDLAEAAVRHDQARVFTDPNLRNQLQQRFDLDQSARKELLSMPRDPVVARRVEEVDADNLIWLRRLMKEKGIPNADQVGERGVQWAWALVQHADRDPRLQAAALTQFAKRYEAGELPADDLAKLTDRILIALGKPQQFGTQFDWLSGNFDPRGIADRAAIDARRQKLGLMPLTDYACMMNQRLKKN
jgi:hypothetical protein